MLPMARALFVVVACPVAVVLGAVVANAFSSGYQPEDPDDPSAMATVMAVWTFDGGSLCRAFTLRDLLPHRDTLDLRFTLAADDVARCSDDFDAYDSRAGWPRVLPGGDLAYPGFGFRVENPPPDFRVVVHRSSGDATWTETRYRVDQEGRVVDLETRGAGAGTGLAALMGGLVGFLVWMVGALVVAWRGWQERRAGAAT